MIRHPPSSPLFPYTTLFRSVERRRAIRRLEQFVIAISGDAGNRLIRSCTTDNIDQTVGCIDIGCAERGAHRGALAHRVIVVVAGGRTIVAQQGWDLLCTVTGRQSADLLRIRRL